MASSASSTVEANPVAAPIFLSAYQSNDSSKSVRAPLRYSIGFAMTYSCQRCVSYLRPRYRARGTSVQFGDTTFDFMRPIIRQWGVPVRWNGLPQRVDQSKAILVS